MLVLQELDTPVEGVMEAEDQVVAYWDKDCLGQGSLYLTERQLIWISPQTRKGVRLPIPAIVIHAASGASEDFPEPCLFLMVDYEKSDIQYTPDNDDVEDEEEEEEVKTVPVRLVPANASRISELFTALNTCQELNPEPDEEMSDHNSNGGNYHDDGELRHNGSHHGEEEYGEGETSDVHEWFTEDSRTDEIRLSAEGRANMERILGSLGDEASADLSGSQEQQHGEGSSKKEEEEEHHEHMDQD